MKRFFEIILISIGLIVVLGLVLSFLGFSSLMNPVDERVVKKSILALDLDGIILDNKDILELLRKYRKDDHVKGVLIRIASPGGVVGPSQELHDEIKRTRTEFKKPVVAYCASVAASGAYYAAVGADKIVTTPGCMMGSIGALMEFVNLEKLYSWAKVERYAITTGEFKDAGAEYRPLSTRQRALFQDLLNNVLTQFKKAIVEGRKMKPEYLDLYADGRVFTGEQAVKMGFADQVGSWDDARKLLGEMTGLGEDPETFKAKKKKSMFDYFEDASSESKFHNLFKQVTSADLKGQPLFILPGAY